MSLLTVQQPVLNPFRGEDFPNGFIIEELEGPKVTITLNGNYLPFQPFSFGGSQRIQKDYYPGYSEPVVQVLGPQEDDMTIRGRFKDKKLPAQLYGAATELQELVDSVRIRGSLCVFRLGEWQRYGFIQNTKFDLKKLSDLNYEITLSLVGFNAPRNARFLQKNKEIPFEINTALIAQANALQGDQIPLTVPLDIADLINQVTNAVAGAIAALTAFVDAIVSTVEDIKSAVNRAQGLIKHTQNQVRNFKNTLNNLEAFVSSSPLTTRYQNARFYSGRLASINNTQALLAQFRQRFSDLVIDLPLARHLVKDGDTLQKISNIYYGTPDDWKTILEYNNLQTTDLTQNTLLEIPRR